MKLKVKSEFSIVKYILIVNISNSKQVSLSKWNGKKNEMKNEMENEMKSAYAVRIFLKTLDWVFGNESKFSLSFHDRFAFFMKCPIHVCI